MHEIKVHRVHQAIMRGMDYAYAGRRTITAEASTEAFNVLAGDWIMRRLDDGFDIATMVNDINGVISTLVRVRRAVIGSGVEVEGSGRVAGTGSRTKGRRGSRMAGD